MYMKLIIIGAVFALLLLSGIIAFVFLKPKAVDGIMSEWSEWGNCSKSCGEGVRKATRTCTEAKNGGVECVGETVKEEPCNTDPCVSPTVIKVGETISLKQNMEDTTKSQNEWLSCYFDACKYAQCPGENGEKISECAGETFGIFKKNGKIGDGIKVGDEVSLKYQNHAPVWMKCTKEGKCNRDGSCSGGGLNIDGSCPNEILTIYTKDGEIGDYIEVGNIILLKSKDNKWFSCYGNHCNTNSGCPGDPLNINKTTNCFGEEFIIYR